MTIPIDILKNLPFFEGLTGKKLEDHINSFQKQKYPKGNIVMYKNSTGSDLFILLHGRVKVVDFDNDKEIIFEFYKTGDYFGEISAIDDGLRSATVITLEESEFLVVPKKFIQDRIKKDLLSYKLLLELCNKLRETNNIISKLALFDVKNRILHLLLKLSDKTNTSYNNGSKTIPRPATKDIAAMCGTSRETVSRILNEFNKSGLISLSKKYIKISDDINSLQS